MGTTSGRMMAWVWMAGAVVGLAGCAGDFVEDPNRPRATRALKPVEQRGDALSETMRDDGTSGVGLSLLTVDMPNKRNESPQVHTILDPVVSAGRPAATQSRTVEQGTVERGPENAAANPAPAKGPGQVKVTWLQKPADGVVIEGDNEGNVTLRVTCPSGIGGLILERTGESWPSVIHVIFGYGDRPFGRLEGFNASEVLGEDRKLELKTVVTKEGPSGGRADVLVPGFSHSQRIAIGWVDMYR